MRYKRLLRGAAIATPVTLVAMSAVALPAVAGTQTATRAAATVAVQPPLTSAQAAALSHFAAQVSRGPVQSLGRDLQLLFPPEHGEVDPGRPQIRRHRDLRDRDALQLRIVGLHQDQAGQLCPDQVGHSVAAAGFFLHGW